MHVDSVTGGAAVTATGRVEITGATTMHYGTGCVAAMAVVAVVAMDASDTRAQSAGCATRFRFCPGCDTFTTISVQSGKVCTIRYTTTGAIFGQKVVVRPRGGIYGTANQTFGAYKANQGFVGNDSFQVDIDYERSGQRMVTHLKANVVVRP
jgi:hypothetical protein